MNYDLQSISSHGGLSRAASASGPAYPPSFLLLALSLLLAFPTITQPFPPAPHHTLYGNVRNEWGDPLLWAGAEITMETAAAVRFTTTLVPGLEPGVNYRLEVPMDAGTTSDPYRPTAQRPLLPFRLKVRIGSTTYLPMEMAGDYSRLGQPAQMTRIDLTLGEDSDGDGLPDGWEWALIAALGTGWTLADLRPGDDADGDGLTNIAEYLAGTYAFDPSDGFLLDLVGFNERGSVLEFLAIRGRTYTLQTSPDLVDWRSVPFRLFSDTGAEPLRDHYRAADVRTLRIEVPFPSEPQANRYFKALVQ
jgi:hypothetical protein